MKGGLLKHYSRIAIFLLIVSGGTFLFSCSIYDDDEYCPTGLNIRFKYDYNMKFADAFNNEVNMVAVYVFDKDGKFLIKKTDSGDALKDKNYYMTFDLEPGTYSIVTWCGLDGTSFVEQNKPVTQVSSITEPTIALVAPLNISESDLHPLWHGQLSNLTVPTDRYEEATVSLVKDTKRIRLVMQQLNGVPMDEANFKFEITNSNGLFDFGNNLISPNVITYTPYVSGNQQIGDVNPATMVYFEASTSRLMENIDSRLKVTRRSDNQKIIDIPLIQYLLLSELEGHKDKMTSQEYLDRQDEYSMVFFLDNNLSWIQLEIIVNGWTVRLNENEL